MLWHFRMFPYWKKSWLQHIAFFYTEELNEHQQIICHPTSLPSGVFDNRDRDFKIITKMAASMRYNFIKPIIPMYAHNMHFRNNSSNANSTNEMKNPKENVGQYFHPRKRQKYKKHQGSSVGKINLLQQSHPGVRQLDEITGDHV